MNLRRWPRPRPLALRVGIVLSALACDPGKLTEPKAVSAPDTALRDQNITPLVDVYVSPHEDDWQLFIGDRFAASARGTTQKVVLIYTSAGDGGRGSAYWNTREAASKASVDTIIGTASWTCAPQTVNAHPIRRCVKGKVISYYLRMPDGNLSGDGFGFGSLELLQTGQPTSAIDGSTTYASWSDFTTTLRTIIAGEVGATTSPYVQVNAPEYDRAINLDDHPDHLATGDAVRAAGQGQPWDQGWWVGYNTQNLPVNVSGAPLDFKDAEFLQYANVMGDAGYGSPWNEPSYQAWLKRTYVRYVNYVPPTPPVAPSNLVATVPAYSVTLTWNDNSADETLFRVQRALDVSGAPDTWVDVVATAPNTVSYVDASVSASTTYWYRVRAESNGGLSAYTTAVSVTTPPPPPPPSAPADLQAAAVSPSQVGLSWTDVATETSYELERAPDVSGAPGAFAPLVTLSANTTGFSDTGLQPSTPYWYRLRSVNPGGASAWVTTSATTPAEVSLVAAYGFNETSGTTTADASGSNNTGTLGTVTRTTSGKFGGALVFSGNYVTVPHAPSLNLTTALTLEAWVYPTVAPNWSTILMKEQPGEFVYAIYAGAGSNPGGWFNIGTSGSTERSVTAQSALALNTWTHVATTYDGTTARLYINGTQVATTAFAGPIATSTGALRIGGNAVWGENFTGRIDEVRLYKRALSAAEVVTDMNTPIGGGASADVTPPTVAITSPSGTGTYTATASPLTVGGTSSDNVGVTTVTWSSDRGGSGTASGTTSWSATGIVLQPGTNVITVTARDAANNVATATLTVTYNVPDTTNPTITITSPTSAATYLTNTTPISLGGTASDDVGVTAVTWSNSTGGTGTASGTTSWTAAGIVLQPGSNVVTVTARDAANNVGTRTLTITLDTASTTTPPLAPSGLGAQAVSATQINLTWTDNSTNETGFAVERAPDAGGVPGTFAQIATVGANATVYNNTGLTPSTAYWYRVRASNGGGSSAYSNTGTATTLSGKPAAPTVLTATASSATVIALAWTDNSTDETGFLVERAPDNAGVAGTYVQIASLGVNVKAYNNTGLTPSTKYWYRVRAAGTVANSDYTNEATATTLSGAPNAPTGLTATASSATAIALAWTDNSTDETGFLVERAPDNAGVAGTYVQIASLGVNVKSYGSTGLTGETRYWYRVRAAGATAPSSYSNEASATTLMAKPTAPSALVAQAISGSEIALQWTDNSTNEASFRLDRAPNNAGAPGTFALLATLGANVTTYNNVSLPANTTYWYRVRSQNAAGNSAYTSAVSATTLAAPPIPPTSLTAKPAAATGTAVTLTWVDNAVDETGFRLEQAPDVGGVPGTYVEIATVATNVKTFTTPALAAATSYWFRVRAYSAYGASAYTNEVTITTPLAMPTNLAVTAVTISGAPAATLTWTRGAAAKVDIYRNGTKFRNAINNTGTNNDTNRVLGTTYSYQVCNAGLTGSANCTSVVSITF